MAVKDFFTDQQKTLIQQTIAEAEKNTSGEIRVHIDQDCKGDPLDRGAEMFKRMKMHQTKQRNGVLFYLAIDSQKFAILGDKGINEKVPADFWNNIRDTMLSHFKRSEFTEGLRIGISMAGEKLKTHFPLLTDDTNELSDDLSFGK